MPKKPLLLVLPHLGTLSLQTRTKLRKSQISNLKVISIVTNYRLCLRVKTNKQMFFVLKIVLQKNFYMVLFVNFSVNSAMNPVMVNVNVIIVRIGQHIRISSLTKKVIFHHLLKVLVC